MTPNPGHLQLMHAALDGEATADEKQELEQLLAVNPEARAEYDALRRLFDALEALPQLDPPPGLAEPAAERHQLFLSRRVLRTVGGPRPPATLTTATPRGLPMSRKISKLTIFSGAAVAAVAILVVGRLVFNVPREGAVGTVVPAERYRAKQIQDSDVKLGDQAVTQLMQTDSFERMIKDPQMRALAVDPGFIALARSPEALSALARAPEAVIALARSPEALSALARAPEAMTALLRSPEAMTALLRSPEAMTALARSPEALSALARAPEAMTALARNPQAFTTMARDPGFGAMAMNPAFARALAMAPNAAAAPGETR